MPLRSLGGAPGSDYINASFMPVGSRWEQEWGEEASEAQRRRGHHCLPVSLPQGLWSPREFIATQGPLPHTVGDFWRLVWEQQSHTLVMLTNCVELGRVSRRRQGPGD